MFWEISSSNWSARQCCLPMREFRYCQCNSSGFHIFIEREKPSPFSFKETLCLDFEARSCSRTGVFEGLSRDVSKTCLVLKTSSHTPLDMEDPETKEGPNRLKIGHAVSVYTNFNSLFSVSASLMWSGSVSPRTFCCKS